MATESQLERYALNLMNDARAKRSLPAYVRDTGLDNGARTHSQLLLGKALQSPDPGATTCPARSGTVSTWMESWGEDHWCDTEASPVSRIQSNWQQLYGVFPQENVGRARQTIQPPDPNWEPYEAMLQAIHNFFMSEEPQNGQHYKNIVSPVFDTVGVGVSISTRQLSVQGVTQQEAVLRVTVDFMKA